MGAASDLSATPWLHVRVSERGDDSASVNVNLPLSAVEAVVALLPDRVMSRGRMRLHRDHELSVSDLRTLWDAVRDAGDSEFVSIDRDDTQIRVARSGDVIQIRIDGLMTAMMMTRAFAWRFRWTWSMRCCRVTTR